MTFRDTIDKSDAKRIADKFASAIAAVSNASPEAARKAAEFIRSKKFSADDADHMRSAINAFAYFIEKAATERERTYRKIYGPKDDDDEFAYMENRKERK